MRLTAAETIFAAIGRGLDARLDLRSCRPLAVAFSGGGDSLALLLATHAWARRHGRPLVAFTVDHGLNPRSAVWTAFCADRARRLGVPHRALVWRGEKPATGMSAAARAARHSLLATAAREAGARVLLMGHTADDRREAAAMRAEGSTVPSPRAWSPSPAWPEGRGVFLLRPMLDLDRSALREALSDIGETWIEDPANANPASLRARVRAEGANAALEPMSERAKAARVLAGRAEIDWAGVIAIPRADVARADESGARAFLGAALLCAGGTCRPPRSDQLARLIARIAGPEEAWAATLAGGRVEARREELLVMRDAGALAAEGMFLERGAPVVFDGRFELTAPADGFAIAPALGRLSRLSAPERAALASIAAPARGALPLAMRGSEVICPLLDPNAWRARNLVQTRLIGACGLIQDEATLSHVGEMGEEPLNQCGSLEGSVHELA